MKEIKKINEHCHVISSFSSIGIILEKDERVIYLIDSGSNESLAKKSANYLYENFTDYKFEVLHTHCHVDHIKGNRAFKNILNSDIYAQPEEIPFGIYPGIEKLYLYSAVPPTFFNNSFFSAKGVNISDINERKPNLNYHKLPGHSQGHTVFSKYGCVFTGDLVFERRIAEKYGYLYMIDIAQQLDSLQKIRGINGECFIPSHGPVIDRSSFSELVDFNMDFIKNQIDEFMDYFSMPITLDELTGKFAVKIKFNGDLPNYYLLRSYVSAVIKYHLEKKHINGFLSEKGLMFESLV